MAGRDFKNYIYIFFLFMRVVTSIFYKRGEPGCERPTLLALLALFVVRLTSFIVVNRTYVYPRTAVTERREEASERLGFGIF